MRKRKLRQKRKWFLGNRLLRHSFYTENFLFQVLHKELLTRITNKNYCKNIKSKQYSVSDTKLLKSGDIVMNPGSVENISIQNHLRISD